MSGCSVTRAVIGSVDLGRDVSATRPLRGVYREHHDCNAAPGMCQVVTSEGVLLVLVYRPGGRYFCYVQSKQGVAIIEMIR